MEALKFKTILSSSLVILLVSCGGGGDSLPATDSKEPKILKTEPASGSVVASNNIFIDVTFNEAIQIPKIVNVDIYPFNSNGNVEKNNAIKLNVSEPFVLDGSKKILTIKPENRLSIDTKYQVTVDGIKDVFGNSMVGVCRWEFATGAYPQTQISKGPLGLCDTLESAGTFNFSAKNVLSVDENAGILPVTVQRTGGVEGDVTVEFVTSNGASSSDAIATVDYEPINTVLKFTAGESEKIIYIKILPDDIIEGNEVFSVTLKNPTGAAFVGANATNEITIKDNVNLPTVTLSYDIKKLILSWPTYTGATHYKLFKFDATTNGGGGFVAINENIPNAPVSGTQNIIYSIDISVHLHDWTTARYLVEACKDTICLAMNEVNTLNASLNAIGYFKGLNSGVLNSSGEFFGEAIALSDSGNILVVGADGESNNATGIATGAGPSKANSNKLAYASGAVYVYNKTSNGWQQVAYIKASNAVKNDRFGYSIAISDLKTAGNNNLIRLVVGASGVNSNTGAAYVFSSKDGVTWTEDAILTASSPDIEDRYGSAVAVSSDASTIAIGVEGDDSNSLIINGVETNNTATISSGAVYVYTLNTNSAWTKQAYIKASNNFKGNQFGHAVALDNSGNILAVSAYTENNNSNTIVNGTGPAPSADNSAQGSGAAYVFNRVTNAGTISWKQQSYIKASNAGNGDNYGFSIALSDNGLRLAVGSIAEDSNAKLVNGTKGDRFLEGGLDSGAVYIYDSNAGNWSESVYIKASNTHQDDRFGWSVAFNKLGTTLAVGAFYETSNAKGINGDLNDVSLNYAGAVYVYQNDGTKWLNSATYVKASNTGPQDGFGQSVAIADSVDGKNQTLAVGAKLEDGNSNGVGGDQNNDLGNYDVGAVYLY